MHNYILGVRDPKGKVVIEYRDIKAIDNLHAIMNIMHKAESDISNLTNMEVIDAGMWIDKDISERDIVLKDNSNNDNNEHLYTLDILLKDGEIVEKTDFSLWYVPKD